MDFKQSFWILAIWVYLYSCQAATGSSVRRDSEAPESVVSEEKKLHGSRSSGPLHAGSHTAHSGAKSANAGSATSHKESLLAHSQPTASNSGSHALTPAISTKANHPQHGKQAKAIVDPEDSEKVLKYILQHIDNMLANQSQAITVPPTPAPLDTGQGRPTSTTPAPLETKPVAGSSVMKGAAVRNETHKPQTDLNPSEIVKAAMVKYEKTAPDSKLAERHANTDRRRHGEIAGDVGDPDRSGKHSGKVSNTNGSEQETEDDRLRSSIPNGTSLKLVPFDEFVENVARKRKDKAKDSDRRRAHERQQPAVVGKLTRETSLVLLQNVTMEAERLHDRLKHHKLKLKSYVDALRNLSVSENERDRKMAARHGHASDIREKVEGIVNPPKQHANRSADHDKDRQGHQLPAHFFAKDVPETLRHRVNLGDLRKSQGFWDKQGKDVDEQHLDRLNAEKAGEQIAYSESPDDQLDLEVVAKDYDRAEEQHWQDKDATKSKEQELSEGSGDAVVDQRIYDYHKVKDNEVGPVRDRLVGMSNHEMFIMNQLISERIHGNILAPPPERCSVQANMKRYRPPEESMKEDDSLLYRVNLKPEIEAALEGGPMDYLPDYKNPCWLSKITDDKGTLWYDFTETGLTYKRMSYLYEMRLSKGSNWRMRCLPYFYLIGVTKSGTTDLYSRLLAHPEIMRPGHKEPMWWNRLTLGMAESLRKPFRYYVDFFDEAAELIRRKVIMKDGKPYHPAITVDATPANLWDYDCWTDIPGNRGLAEPKYTLAHSIKKLVPNARILMILREPTSRLYSQYRMKSHMEPSYTFHKLAMEAIVNFNKCLETRTLRSCAYDYEISKHEFQSPGGVFLRASLYYVFVKDWLDVFPRDQVMVLRTEDYHNDTEGTLAKVFDFLGVSPLAEDRLRSISRQRRLNARTDHADRSQEPMLPETQHLLDDFFRPYNRMLANLLHDKRFKWDDVKSSR